MNLKRCPFCGAAGQFKTTPAGYYVECVRCEARSGIILAHRPETAAKVREEVRERWNERIDRKRASSRGLGQPFYPGFGAKAKKLKTNAEKLRRKLTRFSAHYSQLKETD